jgi:Icc-related predicted phosphoesterase
MKILTMSDVVVNTLYNASVKDRFADVNLVLSCGDLPAYYLEFLVSMLDVPLYYVVGNHADEHHKPSQEKRTERSERSWGVPPGASDAGTVDDERPVGPNGCVNLDGRTVNHKGLLIAGLQGSKWYNGGPYQYSEEQMSRKVLLLQPQLLLNRLRYGRALDILITHAPPAGIHDDVDVAHQGFKTFLKFMDDFAPRYLIHGHKHVYTHGETTVTQYDRTTVINTYGFRRLELEVATP